MKKHNCKGSIKIKVGASGDKKESLNLLEGLIPSVNIDFDITYTKNEEIALK